MRKNAYVFGFINNEHCQRTDDIETGDEQNEDKEQDGQQFLNAKNPEEVRLLLIAIQYFICRA